MLFNSKVTKHPLRRVVLITLLASLALSVAGGGTGVRAQGQTVRIGPITNLAIDNSGSGWAWAGPASPTEDPKFLRISGGSYRPLTVNDSSAGELVRITAALDGIALTSQVGEGWAIGTGGGPRIWRLQGGVWRNYQHKLGRDVLLRDLAVSNDGTDGWITGSGPNLSGVLLRLRDGQWVEQTQTPGSDLRYVAISPNGRYAWAVGQMGGRGSDSAVYQFVNGAWVRHTTFQGRPAAIPQVVAVNGLTVDDNSNGWLISGGGGGPQARNVYITRLTDAGPEQIRVDLPLTTDGSKGVISAYLHQVEVNAVGNGWIAGAAKVQTAAGGTETRPVLVRLLGDKFLEVSTGRLGIKPSQEEPIWLGLFPLTITPDGSHAWLAASEQQKFLSMFEVSEPWFQSLPPSAPALPGPGYCFQESSYCIRGALARYWEANGAVRQFGFPITPEVTERLGDKTYTVQYTERARLEYHPENQQPNDVQLGLLGNTLVDLRLGEDPFKPTQPTNVPGSRYFPQTGHNMGPPFLAMWESSGGLPVFGLPRSEAFEEKNTIDGKTYLVQYFERNRLEYHPENQGTEFELLLGLLGLEQFEETYGYRP